VRGANGRRVSRGRFRVVGCRAFRLDFDGGLGGEGSSADRGLSHQASPLAQKKVVRRRRVLAVPALGFLSISTRGACAHDAANDLALIKIEMHPTVFASLRSGIRLREGVAAFGFPLAGLLATSGNFTLGNVTAVAGLGDDTRILQISASVQPGNSGGPLLDYSGNVVGVVEGKLNAIACHRHQRPGTKCEFRY
jgi:serine protease Do